MRQPPPILAYDNLPPFSTLGREQIGQRLTITAAAEEPNRYIRRRAAMAEAVPSALVSVAVLLGLLIFHWLAMRNPRDPAVAWLLMPAYALFCLALFAFIWHQRYRTRITALENCHANKSAHSAESAFVKNINPYNPPLRIAGRALTICRFPALPRARSSVSSWAAGPTGRR